MAKLLLRLMLVQSLAGLLMPGQYRDAAWIKATWFGNDWVTLVAAVPILWLAQRLVSRGSATGHLLSLGVAWYAIYNYAFYLFGAALNVFFPLYVLSFVSGMLTLFVLMRRMDGAAAFDPRTPARALGGYLVAVAITLAIVWMGIWGAFAFFGRPTPIEPEAFKVVAALDLTLMVPALSIGGVWLWRRQSWGYVIATTAAIQGSLYLSVLSVNAIVPMWREARFSPGELVIWGPLAVSMMVAAVMLLHHAPAREVRHG